MVQWVKDLALSLLAAQVDAVAQVQSLAWELPYAVGKAKNKITLSCRKMFRSTEKLQS